MPRFVLAINSSVVDGQNLDHINGFNNDNRLVNLRFLARIVVL